jgi:hypothetical protein
MVADETKGYVMLIRLASLLSRRRRNAGGETETCESDV